MQTSRKVPSASRSKRASRTPPCIPNENLRDYCTDDNSTFQGVLFLHFAPLAQLHPEGKWCRFQRKYPLKSRDISSRRRICIDPDAPRRAVPEPELPQDSGRTSQDSDTTSRSARGGEMVPKAEKVPPEKSLSEPVNTPRGRKTSVWLSSAHLTGLEELTNDCRGSSPSSPCRARARYSPATAELALPSHPPHWPPPRRLASLDGHLAGPRSAAGPEGKKSARDDLRLVERPANR